MALCLGLLLVFAAVFLLWTPAHAQPQPEGHGKLVSVTVFWREGCGHCQRELVFLKRLQRESGSIFVRKLNVEDADDRLLFDILTEKLKLPKVTPITVVGRRVLIGFSDEQTTGAEILRLVESEPAGLRLEAMLGIEGRADEAGSGVCPLIGPSTACETGGDEYRHVRLPLVGAVDIRQYTLPVLSLVLGLIDGFNPCAMWVLVAFLSALAQVGSRRKMIQFAGMLILAQGAMYAALLNSWFLAFDFIKADRIVRPLVGLVALGGGVFFLWEFVRTEVACRVTGTEQRARVISRLGALSRLEFSLPVVFGILGVAFSVNVVEFACSIGIPQAYTKILEINDVGLLWRQALIGLYILTYLLDDVLVLGLAIWGIEKSGLSTRYIRASNLLGGLLMLVLGAMLLFAPDKLRF